MRKILVFFVISFIVISCVSSPSSNTNSADKIVKTWVYGLGNKDIDILMDTYWPEAIFTFIPPEGENTILNGNEEIRAGQEGGFIDRPDLKIDIRGFEDNGSKIIYTIDVKFPDIDLINILELEKRGNEWRIIDQVVKF